MTVSDTHADTIRAALDEGERVLNAVWEQWWRSRSGSSDASLAHAVANLDLERATEALDALVAERERERARADRAEAALVAFLRDYEEANYSRKSTGARAALSAGSGGRETTLEVAWLVERGQPEGQTPTVWLDDSTAHAGWYGDWTEDANRATKFASREAAEAWMEQRPGSDPARAVEHGWYGH